MAISLPTPAGPPPLRGWGRWWASRCAGCDTWPAGPVGDALCGTCEARFAAARERCPRCALPLDGSDCRHCHAQPLALDACHAAVDYVHPWAQWIQRFKHHDEPGWAPLFARLMCARPGLRQTLCDARLWLPIPMSSQALGARGYNQTWVLSRALCHHLQADHRGLTHRLKPHWLIKPVDTPAQHTLPRQERLHNLRRAFALSPEAAASIRHQHVVLVDDVMTTGATLDAVAQLLKAAGAAQVSGVVFARTPQPGGDA